MSKTFYLIFCVFCLDVATRVEGYRGKRAAAMSSSSSSSSSSSGGGGGGYVGQTSFMQSGFGPTQTSFMGPMGMSQSLGGMTQSSFGFPGSQFPGLPFPDFNIAYQDFFNNLIRAQQYATANPTYVPTFQQQLSALLLQQQAAMAQFPSAFPNVVTTTGGHGPGHTVITTTYPSGTTTVSGGPYPTVSQMSSSSYQGSSYPGAAGSSSSQSQSSSSSGGLGQRIGGGGGGSGGGTGGNVVYTGSTITYGPDGGYGTITSYPGGPDGLGLRIGQELPGPSSGAGSFGVFSSSSSGSSTVNGKTTSYKSSTIGTNDNGRITFRTITE